MLQNISNEKDRQPTLNDKQQLIEVIETKSQRLFDSSTKTMIYAVDYDNFPMLIKAQIPEIRQRAKLMRNRKKEEIFWMQITKVLKGLSSPHNYKEALTKWQQTSLDEKQEVTFFSGKGPRMHLVQK